MAAGIAAAFNAPIAGVLFAIEVLLVDVSISAFTPIMIAAATGALVSEIILDETILLNFRGQQSFDFLLLESTLLKERHCNLIIPGKRAPHRITTTKREPVDLCLPQNSRQEV